MLKNRGQPKKEFTDTAHHKQLMASVDLIVKAMQESERRGWNHGYYNGYKDKRKQTILQHSPDKEDDFSFFATLFYTILIGSILISLWWVVSGQL